MIDLSPDTKFKLTFGGLCVVAATAFWFGWRLQTTLSTISADTKDTRAQVAQATEKMNQRMDGIEAVMNERFTRASDKMTQRMDGIEAVMNDRFTKTAAAEWALRIVVSNPTLKVPDPRDPGHFLNDVPRGELPHKPDSQIYAGGLP